MDLFSILPLCTSLPRTPLSKLVKAPPSRDSSRLLSPDEAGPPEPPSAAFFPPLLDRSAISSLEEIGF